MYRNVCSVYNSCLCRRCSAHSYLICRVSICKTKVQDSRVNGHAFTHALRTLDKHGERPPTVAMCAAAA